jgi:hypothetical protein
MFPPRTIRSIVTCALACALLATSSAAARPLDDARAAGPTSSLAGTTSTLPECAPNLPDGASIGCLPSTTTPRQDLRSPDARDAADAERIAQAMEQYYATYDASKPVTAPAAPAPNDSPWLLISVLAGALALVLASTALIMRRGRVAV